MMMAQRLTAVLWAASLLACIHANQEPLGGNVASGDPASVLAGFDSSPVDWDSETTHIFLRELLQEDSGSSPTTINLPSGTTPLIFKLTMEFAESQETGPNNTVILRSNFVNTITQALGLEENRVLTQAAMQYYQKTTTDSDDVVSTIVYLRIAIVNTTAFFPDQLAASEALSAIQADPDTWVQQVFLSDNTYPTLETVAMEDLALGDTIDAPPIIELPAEWAGMAPVIFTAYMVFDQSEVDQGSDTAAFREAVIAACVAATGVPEDEVQLINLNAIFASAGNGAISYLQSATISAAVLFEDGTTAESWAWALQQQSYVNTVFSSTNFPLIINTTLSNVQYLGLLPGAPPGPTTTPAPIPVFEPGNFLLVHTTVFQFLLTTENQLTAAGVDAFIQQYLQLLAITFGISEESCFVAGQEVTFADLTVVVDSVSSSREVVQSIYLGTYCLFSSHSEALQWAADLPAYMQSMQYTGMSSITIAGTEVFSTGGGLATPLPPAPVDSTYVTYANLTFMAAANLAAIGTAEEFTHYFAQAIPYNLIAYGTSVQLGTLSPVPGYSGPNTEVASNLRVAGFYDGKIRIFGDLTGLGPSVLGSVYIGQGYTCAAIGTALESSVTAEDVWANATFFSTDEGTAQLNVEVLGLYLAEVVGRVVVINDEAGDPLSCAQIAPWSPGVAYILGVQNFQAYNPGTLSGSMAIGIATDGSDGITIAGQITGLAPSSEWLVNIYTGSSCSDIQTTMPSPVTGQNPWIGDQVFMTDANGAAGIYLSLEGFPISSILGKPVVVRDTDTNLLACGVIESSAPQPAVAVGIMNIGAEVLGTESNNLTAILMKTSVNITTELAEHLVYWQELLSDPNAPFHVFVQTPVAGDETPPADGILGGSIDIPVSEPTEAPTASPTAAPTVSPTAAPTISPTAAPTVSPTAAPTVSPTAAPTISPTAAPTISPTAAPTAAPTVSPTASPTVAPTPAPVPTTAPTAAPTVAPTPAPVPTTAPTESPTAAPTLSPTVSPTAPPVAPTASPTASPTAAPTVSPTAAPTTSPTAAPTQAPTASPTAAPTTAPTSSPTAAPTEAAPVPPTYPPCVCPLLLSTTFGFYEPSVPLDVSAQIAQVSSNYTAALSMAFGLPMPGVFITNSQPTTGIADIGGDGSTTVVLSNLVLETTTIFADCSRAAMWGDALKADSLWPREVFTNENMALLDTVAIDSESVDVLPPNEAGYPPGICAGSPTTAPTQAPMPPAISYSNSDAGDVPSCVDAYYVVTWTVKVVPYPKSAEEDDKSSENMEWPEELEMHWDWQTRPMIMELAAQAMGIPPESQLLQHDPETDEEYKLEKIHGFDCDEDGMKKASTYRSYLSTYEAAEDFQSWVSEDLAKLVMQEDVMVCGAKVRIPDDIYFVYFCPDGTTDYQTSEDSSDLAGSYVDSPVGDNYYSYNAAPTQYAAADEPQGSSGVSSLMPFAISALNATVDGGPAAPEANATAQEADGLSQQGQGTDTNTTASGDNSAFSGDSVAVPLFDARLLRVDPTGHAVDDGFVKEVFEVFTAPQQDLGRPAAKRTASPPLAVANAQSATPLHGIAVEPDEALDALLADLLPPDSDATLNGAMDGEEEQPSVCLPVYVVPLKVTLLPGYLNQESGVRAMDKFWSHLADEHFYSVTNVLIRELALRHMPAAEAEGSRMQAWDQIKLGTQVDHTYGRIATSDCGVGVRKQVHYEFVFEEQMSAEKFRDWLKPDDSSGLLESLRQLDPAGVCAAKGETGRAVLEERCVLTAGKHGY